MVYRIFHYKHGEALDKRKLHLLKARRSFYLAVLWQSSADFFDLLSDFHHYNDENDDEDADDDDAFSRINRSSQ